MISFLPTSSFKLKLCVGNIPGHIEEGGECRGEEYDGDEEGVEGALHSTAAHRDEDDVGCAGEDATEGLVRNQSFVFTLQISRDPVEIISSGGRNGPSRDWRISRFCQ